VIDCVREVTGREIPVQIEAPRPGDPTRLIADPAKAKAVLGWEPAMSDLRSIVRSAWNGGFDSHLLKNNLFLAGCNPCQTQRTHRIDSIGPSAK